MLVEAPKPVIEVQPLTPISEITRLPVLLRPREIIESMKTISLGGSDTSLAGRVAEKISSLVISIGGVISKGSERFRHYKKGRSPRCSHGKRMNDRSHQCEGGLFSPISLTRIPFLGVIQGFKTDQKRAA